MKAFISHSSKDKRFVRKLKDDLNENNIETWVDEDELTLGDNLTDKLEEALEKSTHFLLILSPASVQSPWVKMELELALNHIKSETMQKIIPIKYSPCDIPESLSKLILYGDVSKDIRQVHGDKVEFETPGYRDLLVRLCRAIIAKEKELTNEDKKTLKTEIKKETKNEDSLTPPRYIQATYAVLGYKDAESKKNYKNRITSNGSAKNLLPAEIRPIMLPSLLKFLLPNLKLGAPIYFSRNFTLNEIGHFAGFRSNDLYITVDSAIRKNIGIEKGKLYKVEIDSSEPRVNFIKRVF